MKVLILILTILTSKTSYSYFDLSTGVSARSYPGIGGELFIESGYNQRLWGIVNKKKPFYGFIRPSIRVASSAVINNYDAKIEFNPISFISFVRGYKHINSKFDQFNFYDCEVVRCKGDIKRDYTLFKIGIGAKGILALAELQMSNNQYSGDDSLPVAEFRFAALASSQFDKMYRARYVLGAKHSKGMYGIVSEYVRFDNSDQTHNMDLLIYTHKSEKKLYTYGFGQFGSTHWAKGFILVFQMKTNHISGMGLF